MADIRLRSVSPALESALEVLQFAELRDRPNGRISARTLRLFVEGWEDGVRYFTPASRRERDADLPLGPTLSSGVIRWNGMKGAPWSALLWQSGSPVSVGWQVCLTPRSDLVTFDPHLFVLGEMVESTPAPADGILEEIKTMLHLVPVTARLYDRVVWLPFPEFLRPSDAQGPAGSWIFASEVRKHIDPWADTLHGLRGE